MDPIQLAAAAEAAYGQGRHRDAAALLDKLVSVEPGNAAAWLRRANSLHRLDQWDGAADSYRRAFEIVSAASSDSPALDPRLRDIRSKASANLAILGIEQARRFLDALGAEDSDPVAAEHRARLEEALRTLVNPGRAESRSNGANTRSPGFDVAPQPADLSSATKPAVELIRGLAAR